MVDSQILKVIQNSIEAWRDLAVPSIQKITDMESNKKHYNEVYENLEWAIKTVAHIGDDLEELVKEPLSNEDADQIVTKLEELVSQEKPFFDHYNKYNDNGVLEPWETYIEGHALDRSSYSPGWLDDQFYPENSFHNNVWQRVGQLVYDNMPSCQERIQEVVNNDEVYYGFCSFNPE
ncbi:hypothetical protein BDV33DRAFT_170372 [Aspergillus novoparasiticus]|uniref:Uncharacterized protein n=1 Tax=Aspergillus novoparasiticus TaxID=986946 RepID=A0A5N6EWC0_9EURO|nr:hypothetical protein BDV33DRAFT_170372 [Aspergillus novoparasiticus]